MASSVLVAEAEKDHLTETLFERNGPSLKNVLQMVKKKTCHEIEGRHRIMLKMALDLPTKAGEKDEEDEE